MNYVNPQSEIKFYYGYGPGISFGINTRENKTSGHKSTTRDFIYGISGIGYAGVEWFFQSHMSLLVEYRASINFLRRQSKVIHKQNNIVSTKHRTAINFGGNGVKFGLSVYF